MVTDCNHLHIKVTLLEISCQYVLFCQSKQYSFFILRICRNTSLQNCICGKFCFSSLIPKKIAAESHRLLLETYSDYTISIKTCEYWFRRFKSGDFDTCDKERPRQPKNFEDEELEALLDQNSCQTQEKLAES